MNPIALFSSVVRKTKHQNICQCPLMSTFSTTFRTYSSSSPLSSFSSSSHPPPERLGGMAYDRFKQSIKYAIPFTSHCFSPEILTLEAGYIRAYIPYRDMYCSTQNGLMHAPAFTIIVDHLAGFTAWSMLDEPSQFVNTVDLSFNFLRPFQIGNLVIDTKCVDIGSKLAFLESRIYTCKPLTDAELEAVTTQTHGKTANKSVILSSKEPDQLLATSFGTFNIYKLYNSKKTTTDFAVHVPAPHS